MAPDIRTRILDAAVHLLETEGAKSFGQVRIARAAGVKQGNITYHFPKKSDLVAGVVERVNEARRADLAALVESARDLSPAELRDLLFDRLPALALDQKRSRVMLALLVESQDDPAVACTLAEVTRDQRTALAALLRRPLDDLDFEIVLATLSGLSLSALSDNNDEHVAQLLQRFQRWLPILLPLEELAPATPAKPPKSKPAPAKRKPAARRAR